MSTTTQTPARRPSARRRAQVVPAPAPRPAPLHPAERRLRDEGGPDDRATYHCGCGWLFLAPVSTSVSCPRCAAPQAW
ncbi:MAG: hypothetical protein M3P39_09870 [Actinomycetota bacterium]|nr:hypothetical protein [Actinomycetota bacterium]